MRDKRFTNASLVDRKGETRVALALFIRIPKLRNRSRP
jgi:hypothetical protein